MKFNLGIDVGGTFTDFILISSTGGTTVYKTLSTPEDPSIGVMAGIGDLAEILKINYNEFISSIETIVHGTTVATNALLTLKGSKTALITTKGVRDALEMRRGIREEQYNNHYRNVKPLVPRYLRCVVDERIDAEGEIITEFDETELEAIVDFLRKEQVEAIAICFMNAFANNTHEKAAAACLRKHLPECFITASTELLPSIRFYERVSTTAVNAYIGPVVTNYLNNLTSKLDSINFNGTLLIMQSNGGVVTPDIVKNSPAVTVLSGPAAAPTAGTYYSNLLGFDSCITVDMGGTSFDASIVVDNQCLTSIDGEINRYKVSLPSLDIVTIGAGGGSIGCIDNGGLLHMGPQSAGAAPGPICYDKGGKLPACTDANLILGYLNPDFFAGGKIKLNSEKTRELMKSELSDKLGLSLVDTAAGMYRIINTNMAQGVRQVSIEKGHDPREFLFIVAGGAGAIHAGEICRELEIQMFVVPNVASIFCAAGMLLGDLKHDYVYSFLYSFDKIDRNQLLSLYNKMRSEGTNTLHKEGVSQEDIEYYPIMDLRYSGQYHEVQLPVRWQDIEEFNLLNIENIFHQEHNRLFGYSLEEGTEIEVINIRLRAIGKTEKPEFKSDSAGSVDIEAAAKGNRQVYLPEINQMREVAVFDGDMPLSGKVIKGPAIIEKVNTSIFVSQSYSCLVDEFGSFIVYDNEAYPDGYEL